MIPTEVLNLVCDVNEKEIAEQIASDNLKLWTVAWRNAMIRQLQFAFNEEGDN